MNPPLSQCNNNNNIGTTNYNKHGNNDEVGKGSKEESSGMRRCGRNDSSLSFPQKQQFSSSLSSLSSSFEDRKTKKKRRECADDQLFSRRRFSSSSAAAAGSGGSKLSETIANEIEHESSSYQPPPLLQKYLQKSGFSLEEKDSDVNMTLTKTTPDGRKVTVEFQLVSPFQPDGEEDEEGGGGSAEGGGGASGSGGSGAAAAGNGGEMTDFSVTIEERTTNGGGGSNEDSSSSSSSPTTSSGSAAAGGGGGGRGLTFFCTTLQNDDKFRFVVGNVRYFNNAEEKNSAFGYNGPEFEDLDDNFQEGLDEWLGDVGVDSSLCDFIDAAAIDKEHREYVRWLKNVKAFVSSSSSSSVSSGGGATTTGASTGGGK